MVRSTFYNVVRVVDKKATPLRLRCLKICQSIIHVACLLVIVLHENYTNNNPFTMIYCNTYTIKHNLLQWEGSKLRVLKEKATRRFTKFSCSMIPILWDAKLSLSLSLPPPPQRINSLSLSCVTWFSFNKFDLLHSICQSHHTLLEYATFAHIWDCYNHIVHLVVSLHNYSTQFVGKILKH